MDNSAVRSDPNVIYGETYMVTLINSTKYFDPKDSSAELGQEALESDFSMSSANFPLRILPKFQQIYKKSALNQTCIVKNREIITNILHRFQ